MGRRRPELFSLSAELTVTVNAGPTRLTRSPQGVHLRVVPGLTGGTAGSGEGGGGRGGDIFFYLCFYSCFYSCFYLCFYTFFIFGVFIL